MRVPRPNRKLSFAGIGQRDVLKILLGANMLNTPAKEPTKAISGMPFRARSCLRSAVVHSFGN